MAHRAPGFFDVDGRLAALSSEGDDLEHVKPNRLPVARPAVRRSPIANRVRLVQHTAAYWLMLGVRDAIPKSRDLARAEFATLRLCLIQITARVIEAASCVRMAFSASRPEVRCSPDCREPSRHLAPDGQGMRPVHPSCPSNASQQYRSISVESAAQDRTTVKM